MFSDVSDNPTLGVRDGFVSHALHLNSPRRRFQSEFPIYLFFLLFERKGPASTMGEFLLFATRLKILYLIYINFYFKSTGWKLLALFIAVISFSEILCLRPNVCFIFFYSETFQKKIFIPLKRKKKFFYRRWTSPVPGDCFSPGSFFGDFAYVWNLNKFTSREL